MYPENLLLIKHPHADEKSMGVIVLDGRQFKNVQPFRGNPTHSLPSNLFLWAVCGTF